MSWIIFLGIAVIIVGFVISFFPEIRKVGMWLIGIGLAMAIGISVIDFLEKRKQKQP